MIYDIFIVKEEAFAVPRVSEEEKKKSHIRILEAAARLMRENGIAETSVSDVMRAAGLTHGGFYRHFASKDDLVAEVFRHAVDDVTSDLRGAQLPDDRAAAQLRYLARYLSLSHVESAGTGCPLAAMGVELARMSDGAQKSGAEGVAMMAGLLRDQDGTDDKKARAQLALLVGAIILARLTRKEDGGQAALEAARTAMSILDAGWKTP